MWLFSSRSGVSFLAHRSETLPNLFSNFLDPSQSLIKNIACGIPRPQTLRPIATESIGRSVRRGPKMKKQEDARLAVLREYDKWAKDHPNDAKKMGRVRVLRILRERKARPSRFPCRRQQMANCSPLASSRRSIERLTPPAHLISN